MTFLLLLASAIAYFVGLTGLVVGQHSSHGGLRFFRLGRFGLSYYISARRH